jgi:two-component system cell cycle sensor histidine kinase/response regulator CckA
MLVAHGKERARRAFETARLRLARMSSVGAVSLASRFREITAVAADALGVERVGIWLLVDDQRAIRCFHLYERSKLAYSEGAVIYGVDVPTYFAALLERRDIAAEDARSHPLTRELDKPYLEPLGITSMLDAPIYRDGRVCGVVCHEHVGPRRRWSHEDRDFAASVADSIALQFAAAARADAETVARGLRHEMSELRRLRELSRVAAGVAHDFRNLLLVASWLARDISENPDSPIEIVDRADKIRETIDRAQHIAAHLGSMTCDEAVRPEVVDLAVAVECLLPLLRTAVADRCELVLELAEHAGYVLMDRSQLERAVMNLVVNARDAMDDAGRISLSVDAVEVADGESPPGSYARITVGDTGRGMDAATRARIFEPYFTTKATGEGNGLGLSVVHRIVDRVGGFVHVESVPGKGSTFRVYLPRVAAPTRH